MATLASPFGMVKTAPPPPPNRLSDGDRLQFGAIAFALEQAQTAYEAAVTRLNEADALLCTALVAKQRIDEIIVRDYAFDPARDELAVDGTIVRGGLLPDEPS